MGSGTMEDRLYSYNHCNHSFDILLKVIDEDRSLPASSACQISVAVVWRESLQQSWHGHYSDDLGRRMFEASLSYAEAADVAAAGGMWPEWCWYMLVGNPLVLEARYHSKPRHQVVIHVESPGQHQGPSSRIVVSRTMTVG